MFTLTERNILIFLVELLVLLGLARILGEMFRRWGQPVVVAELLVGIVFGPTVLGRVAPGIYAGIFPPHDAVQSTMIETVSWIGVLFLLLANGQDVDISVAWKQRKDSLTIALSDVIIPIILGMGAALLIPQRFLVESQNRLLFAGFVGTALTISALPVALRAMHDLNILKSDMGLLIVSALTINDVLGWVLFTIILGLGTGKVNPFYIGGVLAATVGFAAFCLLIGRRLVDSALTKLKQTDLPQPGSSLTFAVLLGLACGAVTQLIGIHALFGFFLAGIMVGDSPAMSERTREIIDQMVYSIFVPLFFVGIGLKVDFLEGANIPLMLSLAVVGTFGRYIGAYVGTLGSSVARSDRVPIAVAHTPGGAMEIVIGLVAYEAGIITEPIFVAIVFVAVSSSLLVGPWLAWSLKRRRKIRILDFFVHKAFVLRLTGERPPDAIRQLCQSAAVVPGMPDADTLYQAVSDRERTMSTATGSGVAFPHARMQQIKLPKVIVGISRTGIEWDAPDGIDVKWVFMILTPADDVESQVTILAALARMMMQPGVKARLLAAETPQQAWDVLKASVPAVV